MRAFGSHGGTEGQLKYPQDVAVDSSGMVYVSDYHRVSVFTPEGQFVQAFGEGGSGLQLHELAVDSNGVVYACDIRNNCIQMF